jgi:hypothetical protein
MRWLLFWRPPCLLRRVVLNFKHDPTEALEGVLWRARGPWLTLRDVTGHPAGVSRPLLGETVVHRSAIAFLQALP